MQNLRSYRADDAAEVEAVARLFHLAFSATRDGAREWLGTLDPKHLRVSGDPANGCLVLLPMEQCFGGAALPMVGVQGVAVAPEARGRGTARSMMSHVLHELEGAGVPLSSLYASVPRFYEELGYGQAGGAYQTTLRLRELTRPGRHGRHEGGSEGAGTSEIIALDAEHDAALHACQAAFARRFDGAVVRPPYRWRSVANRGGVEQEAFGIVAADADPRERLDGYAILGRKREGELPGELFVGDVGFLTPAAGSRLCALIAAHAPTAPTARLFVPPWHPIVTIAAREWVEAKCMEAWMLRIVRLPEALSTRGWPARVSAALRLDVRDDVLEGNAGEWVIDVADGTARVRRPTRADDQPLVRLSIASLATLYGGWLRPSEAALAGLVEGEPEAFEAADAIFGGTRSWLVDRF